MKKILLLAALAAGVCSMQAQTFDDLFKVQMYHGFGADAVYDKVYPNGSTVEANWYDVLGAYCDLRITNISDETMALSYGFTNVKPTAEEVASNPAAYGSFSICYDFFNMAGAGSCDMIQSGQMLYEVTGETRDVLPNAALQLQLHQFMFTDWDPVSVLLTLQIYDGEEALEGGEYNVTINLNHKYDDAAVGAVGADSSEAEYFNLQGVRVANPENGLFIKKQGGKTSKVIL